MAKSDPVQSPLPKDNMDKIKKKHFNKYWYALPNYHQHSKRDIERAYMSAWDDALAWKEEQEQMSKDSLEQTKEEARLAQGG